MLAGGCNRVLSDTKRHSDPKRLDVSMLVGGLCVNSVLHRPCLSGSRLHVCTRRRPLSQLGQKGGGWRAWLQLKPEMANPDWADLSHVRPRGKRVPMALEKDLGPVRLIPKRRFAQDHFELIRKGGSPEKELRSKTSQI